jgi:hypothetical protein
MRQGNCRANMSRIRFEQDLDITMDETKLMASIYAIDHLCEIKSRFNFFQWRLVKQKHQEIAAAHIFQH